MTFKALATMLFPMVLLVAGPASAASAPTATVVVHNQTVTQHFPDDVCGPRANTTTYTLKIEQVRYNERADGSYTFRYLAVVTYVSDYDDPALPTLSGSMTEVQNFIATPGGTFVGTLTFRDFYGEIRILTRFHVTVVDDEVKVDIYHDSVVGCP